MQVRAVSIVLLFTYFSYLLYLLLIIGNSGEFGIGGGGEGGLVKLNIKKYHSGELVYFYRISNFKIIWIN